MLILVLAANTGFADFPRLASFQAGDSFLPRQLTKRGHRLVFSNGIIALAGTAARPRRRHQRRRHPPDPALRHRRVRRLHALAGRHDQAPPAPQGAGLADRASSSTASARAISAFVVVIVFITRFDDAWIMLIVMPLFVFMLLRLNRQYEHEDAAARARRARRRHRADPAPPRRAGVRRPPRHGLGPGDPVRPHAHARRAARGALRASTRRPPPSWPRSGPAPGCTGCPLEIVDCPDRRLIRAAVECVVRELSDGETEVSVLLPDRKYRGIWHRVLHDKTADSLLEQLSRLPHANVTSVPFHLDARDDGAGPAVGHRHPSLRPHAARAARSSDRAPPPADAEPNGLAPRARAASRSRRPRWRAAGEGRRPRPVGAGGAAARRAHAWS